MASRTFKSGATRDTNEDKLDYEAFLSPPVLHCYAQYLHKNRFQSGGILREGDNWQKGIPLDVYMKSAWRHFMDWWIFHRHGKGYDPIGTQEALCAVLFNTMGYLHEVLKENEKST